MTIECERPHIVLIHMKSIVQWEYHAMQRLTQRQHRVTWSTHWGRVTRICVSKLTNIGSDNGLSPGRRQAIIWTNDEILLIGVLGTNFSANLIEIQTFSFWKNRLQVSSAKWWPFCLGLNELPHWPLWDVAVILRVQYLNTCHGFTVYEHFLWNCSKPLPEPMLTHCQLDP